MDKATKVFQKLAQDFQGYVSPEEGISEKKEKKLKERGYSQVSGEEYATRRGNVMLEDAKNEVKKYRQKADQRKKTLTAGGALLGGVAPGAMSLSTKLPTKAKAAIVAGGALLGGGGGYLLGRSTEKEVTRKTDKALKGLRKKVDAMKDVYSVGESGGRKFYIKDNK